LPLNDFGVMCFLLSNQFISVFASNTTERSERTTRHWCGAPFVELN
jgi:hypothetical protein